jgi:hypothetical protein
MDKAEGKLTPWDMLSGSIMKDLFGLNRWDPDSQNTILKQIIEAKKGNYPEQIKINPKMLYGTESEVAGMRTCLTLAGLPINDHMFNWQFGTCFYHKDIALACSLDGTYDLGNQVIAIRTDPENNVYTPQNETIYLEGKGVIEHKTTGINFDSKEICPEMYEIQAKCNLEVMASNDPSYKWYAVSVVHGNDPYIYLFERDKFFCIELEKKVNDFYRRVEEQDWYDPQSSKGCDLINPDIDEEKRINLSTDSIDAMKRIVERKALIKEMEALNEADEVTIKGEMQDAKEGIGFYEDDDGNEVLITGKRRIINRKATPEKYIPAKPSTKVLTSGIYIKETVND